MGTASESNPAMVGPYNNWIEWAEQHIAHEIGHAVGQAPKLTLPVYYLTVVPLTYPAHVLKTNFNIRNSWILSKFLLEAYSTIARSHLSNIAQAEHYCEYVLVLS